MQTGRGFWPASFISNASDEVPATAAGTATTANQGRITLAEPRLRSQAAGRHWCWIAGPRATGSTVGSPRCCWMLSPGRGASGGVGRCRRCVSPSSKLSRRGRRCWWRNDHRGVLPKNPLTSGYPQQDHGYRTGSVLPVSMEFLGRNWRSSTPRSIRRRQLTAPTQPSPIVSGR